MNSDLLLLSLLACLVAGSLTAWLIYARRHSLTPAPATLSTSSAFHSNGPNVSRPAFSDDYGSAIGQAELGVEDEEDHAHALDPGCADSGEDFTRAACPQCSSSRIQKKRHGRKAGGSVGAMAGLASGFTMALSGAEIGATAGLVAGPIGVAFGSLAGATIAGLAAGAAGCAVGAAMGDVIDENVLNGFACLDCGHKFDIDPN